MKSAGRAIGSLFAALTMALLAACASTSRLDSTGEYVSDAVLTAQVKTALFNEPTLKSDEIRVQTYRGVVRLSGFVSSTADEEICHGMAARTARASCIRSGFRRGLDKAGSARCLPCVPRHEL